VTHVAPSGGPLTPVSAYWNDINAHHFAAAYTQLAPGTLSLSRSAFTAYEDAVGVLAAHFTGHVAGPAGAATKVTVSSLVTEDEEIGCQRWSGSYLVTEATGHWSISRAAIVPTRC
jgi:hypothetical protein